MSGDLVIQLAQEALMIVLLVSAPMLGLGVSGDDVDSGADAGVHSEDYCGVCRHSDLWPLDAAHHGGVRIERLHQPPHVPAMRRAAHGSV